jgi:hypothetical protein
MLGCYDITIFDFQAQFSFTEKDLMLKHITLCNVIDSSNGLYLFAVSHPKFYDPIQLRDIIVRTPS